ncbi:hypothetical protein OSTOST_11810, partial [Ostertagia ostertagi]
MDKTAFRTVLLHEFKLGRTATEATTNVNMAWEKTLHRKERLLAGFKRRNEDDSLEDKERTGRPSLVGST